ncbi:MAG TPA: branched-chain amino acid ABC transporter permease [Dehalococcoidia bacterium]|nr:branched-chain amino acid ABC transporter permease [Dehalococcoidia bacterium]
MRWPSGTYSYKYDEDMAIFRTKTQWGLLIAFLILMALVPYLVAPDLVTIVLIMLIWIVATQGLQLLLGYTGQISVCQSAIMGVGAFTTGILCSKFAIMSYWAALPFAGIMAGLVGMLFGWPSFKVKGLYLALVTIGAQLIIIYAIVHMPDLTGGVVGIVIPAPRIGPIDFGTTEWYYLGLVMAVLATFIVKNIARTRAGRAFVAVRDNDIAAEVMGINIFAYKMLSFFIGCFLGGVAGWLFVGYIGFAQVDHYTLDESVWILGMVVVGGAGSSLGTIFGVVFIQAIRELATWGGPIIADAIPSLGIGFSMALPLLSLGFAYAVFLIFEPRGLAHRWEIIKRSYRLWPYSR